MLQKVSDASLKAYIAFKGFFRSFGKDERGLSGVVVAVLLILVAVLAVLLIWGFLGTFLRDMWLNLTSQAEGIQ